MKYQNIKINFRKREILKVSEFIINSNSLIYINGVSGSGKSVFLKYLSGKLDFYSGFSLDGNIDYNGLKKDYKEFFENFHDFLYTGQDPEVYLTSVYCEDELASVIPEKDFEIAEKKAHEFLLQNRPDFIGRRISSLSQGEMQELLIFTAILSEKEVLFLDEPFAKLDRIERKKLSKIIKYYSKNFNISFIIAGHGVELFHLEFDRSFKIEMGTLKELDVKKFKSELVDFFKKSRIFKENKKEILFKIEDLNFSYHKRKIFDDFSCSFYSGAINYICGLNGCGKTTLIKIISSFIKVKNTNFKTLKDRIILIDRNPDYHFIHDSIEEEINSICKKDIEDEFLELGFHSSVKKMDHLSYGQKMRFLIKLYSFLNKDIFIFDESFSGQDTKNIEIIYSIFRELLEKGKTVIITGQDHFYSARFSDKLIKIGRVKE